jgi:succinate dehydrogenase / fumarate reductase cytochrome b subunit
VSVIASRKAAKQSLTLNAEMASQKAARNDGLLSRRPMYKNSGFISFVLRRFTGVVLVLYLFTHMLVIGSATQGAAAFDATLKVVEGPVFKVMEIALIAAVAYHAFDGVRLLIVHYFNVIDYRRSLFYAAFAVAAFFTAIGGLLILQLLLYQA